MILLPVIIVALPLLLALCVAIDGLNHGPRPKPEPLPRWARHMPWDPLVDWWHEVRRCKHERYYESRSYTHDGTPWRVFHCKDCDYSDRGHVYGPSRGQPGSEDWEGATET